MVVQRRRLTVYDLTEIEMGRRDGWSVGEIERDPGRLSGTVCEEIRRHGDAAGYRAATAEAESAAVANAPVASHDCAIRAAIRRDGPSVAARLVA